MNTTRRQFLHAFLALPTFLLIGCGDKVVVNKLPKGAKVVALGDSLTYGYGAERGQDYPSVLSKKTAWQIDNMGINGDTSADVLARLDKVMQKSPRLVLLGIGGNDVLRRVPSDKTTHNITQIIKRLQDGGIQVVLIAQPHLSVSAAFGKASDNPIYQKIATNTQVPLVAKLWSNILSDKSLKSDQIHANAQGYAYFAEGIYKALQKIGYI